MQLALGEPNMTAVSAVFTVECDLDHAPRAGGSVKSDDAAGGPST
jgi:hypothetical protein